MSKHLKEIDIPGYGNINISDIATGEYAKYDPELEHKNLLYIATDNNSILYNGKLLGIPVYNAVRVTPFPYAHANIVIIEGLNFDSLPPIFILKDSISYVNESLFRLGDAVVIPLCFKTYSRQGALVMRIDSVPTSNFLYTIWTKIQIESGEYHFGWYNSANYNFRSVATLGEDGKIPSSYLPSYVDDVLEYSTFDNFPTTGESGKIYVDKATNKTYRWSGSTYIFVGNPLELGETSNTAYPGDKGKEVYNTLDKDAFIVSDSNTNGIAVGITDEGILLEYGVVELNNGKDFKSTLLPLSTLRSAGVMSAADKSILDRLKGLDRIDVFASGDAWDAEVLPEDDSVNIKIPFVTLDGNNNGAKDRMLNIPAATTEKAGAMSASDKVKLDSIEVAKLYTSDNLDLSNYVTTDDISELNLEILTLKEQNSALLEQINLLKSLVESLLTAVTMNII